MRYTNIFSTLLFTTVLVSGVAARDASVFGTEDAAIPTLPKDLQNLKAPPPKTSTPKAPLAPSKPPPASPPPPPKQKPLSQRTTSFKSIKATKATWDQLRKVCGRNTKRSLYRRAAPAGYLNVPIGGITEATSTQQLWTEDLVSCLGIAITGNPGKIPYDKILAHFYASELNLDSDFDKLAEKVSTSGMKDLHAYLSVPD